MRIIKITFTILMIGFVILTPVKTWATTNDYSSDLTRANCEYFSISDANQTGLDITGDMTVEAWVMPDSSPSYNIEYSIVDKRPGGSSSYAFMYRNHLGVMKFWTCLDDGSGFNCNASISYTLTADGTTWTHIAWVYDASAGSIEYYVNGSSVNTGTGTHTSIQDGTGAFQIGRTDLDATCWDGHIDEVRIWDDIRTSTEISDNYQTELVGNETNLQGYWQFDGQDGTDETSNSNDLTEVNTPGYSTDVPFAGSSPAVEAPPTQEFWVE